MSGPVAAKDLYLNASKDTVVEEGPDAAFLLARAGRDVPAEWAHLVTDSGNPKRMKRGGDKKMKGGGDK